MATSSCSQMVRAPLVPAFSMSNVSGSPSKTSVEPAYGSSGRGAVMLTPGIGSGHRRRRRIGALGGFATARHKPLQRGRLALDRGRVSTLHGIPQIDVSTKLPEALHLGTTGRFELPSLQKEKPAHQREPHDHAGRHEGECHRGIGRKPEPTKEKREHRFTDTEPVDRDRRHLDHEAHRNEHRAQEDWQRN